MNTKALIELQLQWWHRENSVPLVATFADNQTPGGGAHINMTPDQIVENCLNSLKGNNRPPADSLQTLRVDFGTAFLPALAGAEMRYDADTSWAEPCADSLDDLTVKSFDPDHPLWIQYVSCLEAVCGNWSWDTYLPSVGAVLGPMDILAGMLGPQVLATELYTNPDKVKKCAMDTAKLFLDVFEAQKKMIRAAGLTDGMADWMSTWLPGDGICYSEDFSALVGEDHFREFFLEPNSMITRKLNTSYLHVHSAALPCLPAILDLPGLSAIELSHDPVGPGLDEIIEAAITIQKAGKPLQLSNWMHPLTMDEIERILAKVDPRGLKISLQASSIDEAHKLYNFVKDRPT